MEDPFCGRYADEETMGISGSTPDLATVVELDGAILVQVDSVCDDAYNGLAGTP